MMEGAFFVGRKEILDWINNTLDLNLAKIEDTANGAVACQLLDIMYPGQVPMHKVNWAAKQDFEFVANYKILQNCFSKLNIDRFIDVDRLISGRYMDNLEFMQWFKKFFELSVADKGAYDAFAQRCKGKGGHIYNNGGKRSATSKPASAPAKSGVAAASTRNLPTAKSRVDVKTATTTTTPAITSNQENAAPNHTRNTGGSGVDKDKEIANLRASLEDSRRAYSELRTEMEGIDKEREFYFDKLRDIEVMLQDVEEKGMGTELTAAIFKILYATADGFEPVVEEPIASVTLNTVPEAEPAVAAQDTEAY